MITCMEGWSSNWLVAWKWNHCHPFQVISNLTLLMIIVIFYLCSTKLNPFDFCCLLQMLWVQPSWFWLSSLMCAPKVLMCAPNPLNLCCFLLMFAFGPLDLRHPLICELNHLILHCLILILWTCPSLIIIF